MTLSNEQVEIMRHTQRRAANGLYCGDGPDMTALVEYGLMELAGRAPGVPDPYFRLTAAGTVALALIEQAREALDKIPAEFLQGIPEYLRPDWAQKGQAAEPRGYRRLKERPAGGVPRVYVTIHHGCGGWNSAVWGWEADPEVTGAGFYQPLTSGVTNTLGRGTREEAVAEAESWAEAEGLPLWIPEDTKHEG